jgi:hypothetical protein
LDVDPAVWWRSSSVDSSFQGRVGSSRGRGTCVAGIGRCALFEWRIIRGGRCRDNYTAGKIVAIFEAETGNAALERYAASLSRKFRRVNNDRIQIIGDEPYTIGFLRTDREWPTSRTDKATGARTRCFGTRSAARAPRLTLGRGEARGSYPSKTGSSTPRPTPQRDREAGANVHPSIRLPACRIAATRSAASSRLTSVSGRRARGPDARYPLVPPRLLVRADATEAGAISMHSRVA